MADVYNADIYMLLIVRVQNVNLISEMNWIFNLHFVFTHEIQNK